MMPLLKGDSQASGTIMFHIPAIRKLTFNPSLLTSSPFSFSVTHSFFLTTGEDRNSLWFMLLKAAVCLLPVPSQVFQCLCSLNSRKSQSFTQIYFHVILTNTWIVYASFIPNPVLPNYPWPRNKSYSHLCCHLEASKALKVLGALCFKERLDPLDLHRVMLHREYIEIHHDPVTKPKSGVGVASNMSSWGRGMTEWMTVSPSDPREVWQIQHQIIGFRKKSVTTSLLRTETVTIKPTNNGYNSSGLWWLHTESLWNAVS